MLRVICNGCKLEIDPEKKGIENLAGLFDKGWIGDGNFKHVCPTCIKNYEALKKTIDDIEVKKLRLDLQLETELQEPVLEPIDLVKPVKEKKNKPFPVYICRYSKENDLKMKVRCITFTYNVLGLEEVRKHEEITHKLIYTKMWGTERQPTGFRCKKKETED